MHCIALKAFVMRSLCQEPPQKGSGGSAARLRETTARPQNGPAGWPWCFRMWPFRLPLSPQFSQKQILYIPNVLLVQVEPRCRWGWLGPPPEMHSLFAPYIHDAAQRCHCWQIDSVSWESWRSSTSAGCWRFSTSSGCELSSQKQSVYHYFLL